MDNATLSRMDFESARDAMKTKKFTLEDIVDAIESGDSSGFCTKCGAEATGVEPDAKRYLCEDCGEHAVFGAEELLMMLA